MEKLLIASVPLLGVLILLLVVGVGIWIEEKTGIFGLPFSFILAAIIIGLFIYFT